MKMIDFFSKAYGNVKPEHAVWAGICMSRDQSVLTCYSQDYHNAKVLLP